MLNYLYAILESEARLAISELGLDPGIGFLHSDTRTRDSLACDLMEPIRPKVDTFPLDSLRRALLQRKWFFEERNGNCRLTSDCAAELSETSRLWREALGPYAEWIANALWSTTSRPSRTEAPATRLTQRRKREAKGIPVHTPIVQMVSGEKSFVCAKAGPIGRTRSDSEARRADTQRRQAATLKAWNATQKPKWLDENFSREKIQPRLAGIEIPVLMSVLGISKAYAADICAGRRPHPRHWVNLAHLTGSHRKD